MSDPLAIRIEAALRQLESNAYNAEHWHPAPWSPAGLQILDADEKLTAAGDSSTVDHFAAFDPSSVLRLITGMRAILQVVPEIEDMEGQIQGEWGLSTDDPAEINECSNALLRTLASMLGIETNEQTT